MFTRYLLQTYVCITCLYYGNDRFTLHWGTVLHIPFIRSRKQFLHLGLVLQETGVPNRIFIFSIHIRQRVCTFSDYSTYDITYESVTLHFRLVLVDASPNCGPRPSTKFSEFIFRNIKIFNFLNFTILCVPLDTPTILYLQHYRSSSEGWNTHIICYKCSGECTPAFRKFVVDLPPLNLSSVMYVHVNHRPFVIWLRIQSSISHSIYQSSVLHI
jgi:hypothetical protein